MLSLVSLLKGSPFQLLITKRIAFRQGDALNVCGLGEYMLGRCQPAVAFQNYQDELSSHYPRHNPDSLSLLKSFPGNLILCGHTHGGQVNLPWLWKKYTVLENAAYAKTGLYKIAPNKSIYVSRGLGSVFPSASFLPLNWSYYTGGGIMKISAILLAGGIGTRMQWRGRNSFCR